MKVLIISAAFPPIKSGGSDYAKRMATELAGRGVDVTVLTSTKAATQSSASISSSDKPVGAETFLTLPLIPRWGWTAFPKIMDTVRVLQPDVIDIHFTGWIYNDHPMITFLPTFVRKWNPNVHVSVHFESFGGIQRQLSNAIEATVRFFMSVVVGRQNINYDYGTLVRDSSSLIFLNERDRREICNVMPSALAKAALLPPPPIMPMAPQLNESERAQLLERFDIKSADPLLAYYGYVYPGKGLETLFQAVKLLAENFPQTKLLLIGDVPEQSALERAGHANYLSELDAIARELGISQRIVRVGYSPADSVLPSQLLQLSHLCVLPYDWGVMLNNSTFSFAAEHAKPIITTRGGLTEEAFVHGDNAWLVEPRAAEQLRQSIETILNSDHIAQKLSAGAIKMAREYFNWNKMIDETLRIWKNEKMSATSRVGS